VERQYEYVDNDENISIEGLAKSEKTFKEK